MSVQTVQTAYEQLLSEGYIYLIERNGYFVSEVEYPYSFEDQVRTTRRNSKRYK
ncbi:hypothetical protein [Ureibacillus acetophenoni]